MQNESGNWLYISHGRVYESYDEFINQVHDKLPGFGHWNESLKCLKEKIDKNVIIWNANESGGYWPLLSDDNDNILEIIHNYSHPDNKIWYVNGDANIISIYKDWCELVKPKMRINMYPLVPSCARDIFFNRLRKFYELYQPVEDMVIPAKYRVISMVNQPKISRILTLRELAGRPGFIYSFNCTEIGMIAGDGTDSGESFLEMKKKLIHKKDWRKKSWRWVKDGNAIEFENRSDETRFVDLTCRHNMSNDRFDQTKRVNFKTPFTNGFEDDTDAFHDFLPAQEWLESDIDLIIETYHVRAFGLSDKTCKALGHCKPFLVVGCAGWYKIFQQLGFKLYDELFDYSFDEIESFRYRHAAMMSQIKDILNMDRSVLDKKILDIQDKIYYNKRQLLDCRKDDVDVFSIVKEIEETW